MPLVNCTVWLNCQPVEQGVIPLICPVALSNTLPVMVLGSKCLALVQESVVVSILFVARTRNVFIPVQVLKGFLREYNDFSWT